MHYPVEAENRKDLSYVSFYTKFDCKSSVITAAEKSN